MSGGIIRAAAVSGDFMAMAPCSPLESALTGVRFERGAVGSAVSGLELEAMLCSISAEEFLSLLFD